MFGKKLKEYNLSKDELAKLQYARIKTENGTIWLKLYPESAPNTVANFAELANSGFYDNLQFHRVIPGFMAQGGCPHSGPTGNSAQAGTGGPGWEIPCETDNGVKHKKGSFSMAHAGKDTGGSQFFITFVPTPHLDGVHTVFGGIDDEDAESMEGLDTIDSNDIIEEIRVVETKE